MVLKARNKITGEVVEIGGGNFLNEPICDYCGGYMGTPEFDSGSSETKYCRCWEIFRGESWTGDPEFKGLIKDLAIGFADYLLSGSIVRYTAGSIKEGSVGKIVYPPEFALLRGRLKNDGEEIFKDFLETLKKEE